MKKKVLKKIDFLETFDQFIKVSASGKRTLKNGKRLREGSVNNYKYLRKLLTDFCVAKDFQLRIYPLNKVGKPLLNQEKKYWKTFYQKFTEYLYTDLGHFDNYVGNNIKMLRVFFNYLETEKGIVTGGFHRQFYVRKENIQIVTLLPEQLNFLIHNNKLEEKLDESLAKTKDIFVFGCTVALRVSDLLNLKKSNIENINGEIYLKAQSKKTGTLSRIKLPDYAISIITKYKNRYTTLLPPISNGRLNLNIKKLIEAVGWTEPYIKTRERRGVPVPVFKEPKKKKHYRFCDLVTSHTMRRTAITTMLCLGMPEHLVRKISGHAPGSKEFFKYVELSQVYLDTETNRMFENLKSKQYSEQIQAI